MDLHHSKSSEHKKPQEHYGAKEPANVFGTELLNKKQQGEYDHNDRDNSDCRID